MGLSADKPKKNQTWAGSPNKGSVQFSCCGTVLEYFHFLYVMRAASEPTEQGF